MKAKHTPGPWRTDGRELVFAYKRFVAQCLTDGGIDTEACLANARLITAAPDMLAALMEIREYYDDREACPLCGLVAAEDNGHDETCPTTRIDAAIAKARGAP